MSSDVSVAEPPVPGGSVPPVDVARPVDVDRVRLLGHVLGASPWLIAIFRLPDLRLVYLNETAAGRLNPKADCEASELILDELVGVAQLQRLRAEILPKARVLGRWAGECELRDVWGSEFMVS